MTQFDRKAAAAKLGAVQLTPANRLFVDYWLSRHTDDGRLCESNLPEEILIAARRFTATADVKPGRSAIVTDVGPGIARFLAYDLRGFDLIEGLPEDLRPIRLERTAEIARGAIALSRQHLVTPEGDEFFFEEVNVPFGPLTADGRRRCVNHVDFTPLAHYPLKLTARPDRPALECRYIDLGFSDRLRWT